MENLYLKWKDYKTDNKYVLGALMKDNEKHMYYFKLNKEYVDIAKKEAGFNMAVLPFEFDQIYESPEIFSFFKIRLPKIENLDKEDIEELLEDLDMEEYDDFEYLRKTGGEVMTDNFILEEDK